MRRTQGKDDYKVGKDDYKVNTLLWDFESVYIHPVYCVVVLYHGGNHAAFGNVFATYGIS